MEREDADGALDSWAQFCTLSNELLAGDGDLAVGPRLAPVVGDLCTRGLATLVRDYFLHSLEETFRNHAVKKFWQHFHPYCSASTVDRIKFCAPYVALIRRYGYAIRRYPDTLFLKKH
ncbi:Anaphase-promoting complex subunit 2 [Zea mays]|uniref:Anaphase-promoting complex subunit 2 n=1 Tax=Zea mays TaxID=4577 RepID=A0A1D6GV95_MAIZE|nr:Anaphase-promoting complex subunit 2 [Zea mays]